MEKNKKLIALFHRYLDDQCTPEELEILLSYFGSADEPELRRLIHEELSKPADTDLREHAQVLETVYNDISRRMHEKPAGRVVPLRRWLIRGVAAASVIAILVIVSFSIWRHLPGKSVVEQERVVTLRGQRKQLQLSDGTRVWMGPGSVLEYPARFTDKQREVTLQGEAYFEVRHDLSHIFIVHAGGLHTRVLGTSFNIRAYDDSTDAEVVLVTGKVNVSANKNVSGPLELAPDQHVVYNRKMQSLRKEDYPDAGQVLARRDGDLIYKGIPLEKVIADIRLFYNIDIVLSPGMRKCMYYGKFSPADDPHLIPQQIASAFNASVKKDDSGVWQIYGGDCSNN